MTHPAFPTIEPQFTSGATYPKLTIEENMALWDFWDKLGIFVLPKDRIGKSAAPRMRWGEKNRQNYTRENAYRDQLRDDVSGWIALPGTLSNRLCVVDIDPSEMIAGGQVPSTVYEEVQSQSESSFVIMTPSGGVHIYYRIPDHRPLPKNATNRRYRGIDIRSDRGIVATLGGYARYEGTTAERKGLQDGHCAPYAVLDDGDYSHIPVMSDGLYDFLFAQDHRAAENYEGTYEGSARVEAHRAESHSVQVAQTLQLLEIVLDNWSNDDYDSWMRMKMAAHHGSNGDETVMEYILNHPHIHWHDGEKGKHAFIQSWRTHEQREGGITVGSLYYYAKEKGWRATTGAEISDVDMHEIHVQYITDYIDELIEIPEINLLISQTGSGKTYAFKALYEELGRPRTVILVPYRKLAVTMCETLRNDHGLPVTLYLEDDHESTKAADVLAEAHILVTTLQTFAKKVFPEVVLSDYGLVYVEECDQIIRDHALGGGISHVSQEEAVRGFAVLRDVFEQVDYVWLVDATMTRVSEELVQAMAASREYVKTKNTLVKPKAPATFVNELTEIYQILADGLRENKRCVCIADTVNKATETFELMARLGVLAGKKAILITANTANDREVREFLQDVNQKAKEYDLVIYNSVMGSGVSITSTVPDLIVQICTFLPPTRNIQLLNRYRGQEGVDLYVYYPFVTSDLFPPTVKELMAAKDYVGRRTQAIVMAPMAERDEDTQLREQLTALTMADEEAQKARGRDIYAALLKADGRAIHYVEEIPTTGTIQHNIIAVREAKKLYRQELKAEWPETPPIDRKRKALPDYSPRQVAQGQIHAKIEKVLNDVIPKDQDPEEVYDTVFSISPHLTILEAFIYRDDALAQSEELLADRARALTTIKNTLGMIGLIDLARILFVKGWEEEIDEDTWAGRSGDFLRELEKLQEDFNSVFQGRDAYGKALASAKADSEAGAAYVMAKKILKRCGMNLSRERRGNQKNYHYHYRISNLDTVLNLLRWRYREEPDMNAFTTEVIRQKLAYRHEAQELYAEMTPAERRRVTQILMEGMQFADTVYRVKDDPEGVINDF